jgi:hypothetical protein
MKLCRDEFGRIAATADLKVSTKWDFRLSSLRMMASDNLRVNQENGLIWYLDHSLSHQ